jgi:3-hydroxy-3-methylglutaryl CoA synthase/uncharacterized OB-fold protein
MVGLVRLGIHLPRRRLDRALLAQAWGGRAAPGRRTIAGWDEDALTMATDATLACLGDGDPGAVEGLWFASTSAPYLEKQIASVVATACDLPRTTVTTDGAGSVRAGVAALRGALDAVRAGSIARGIAVAADARPAEPGSELEGQLGDGAVAVMVGTEGVIAELVSQACVSEEFTWTWRTDEQRFVQLSDARFAATHAWARDVPEAVAAALRRAEVPPAKVAKLALAAPDARTAADGAKKIGCAADALVPAFAAEAGMLGAAEPLLLLARALETAQPGDVIVVAGFGEGAEALVFRATDALPAARPAPVADALARGVDVASYAKWLRSRNVLPLEVGGDPMPTYIEWKELKQDVRLYGSRCEACGMVQYPQARVCLACNAQDRMTDHKLAKTGTVFTYTIDNLAMVPEHPMPMVVVDLDGGGRVYVQGTDCAEGDIDVGKRVRLTFRRLSEAQGNRNYFWKCRPA